MSNYILEIESSEPNCGLCKHVYTPGDVMWRLATPETAGSTGKPPFLSLCLECMINIQTLEEDVD